MYTIHPIVDGKYTWAVFDDGNWMVEKFVTEEEARRYCQLANEDSKDSVKYFSQDDIDALNEI